MNNAKSILIKGAAIIIAVAAIIILTQQMLKYKNAAEAFKIQAKAFDDSLHVVRTEYGNLYTKFGRIADLSNDLQDSLDNSKKTIFRLTEKLKIKLEIESAKDQLVTAKGDSILSKDFFDIYEDPGLVLQDSSYVIFTKKDSTWNANKTSKYQIDLVLKQRIGRDKKGAFYGSVETLSSHANIMDITTEISDDYIAPGISDDISNNYNHLIGLKASVDNFSVASGISIYNKNLEYSIEYLVFQKNIDTTLKWYERLRVGIVYFIF